MYVLYNVGMFSKTTCSLPDTGGSHKDFRPNCIIMPGVHQQGRVCVSKIHILGPMEAT